MLSTCTWTSGKNLGRFPIGCLDLMPARDMRISALPLSPICRSSHGFPQDLGSVKGNRCQEELAVVAFLMTACPDFSGVFFFIFLFPFLLGLSSHWRPVSPSLLSSTFQINFAIAFLLIFFICLRWEEPGIQLQESWAISNLITFNWWATFKRSYLITF